MSTGSHFDLAALGAALDEERRARGTTWAQMAKDVHNGPGGFAAISASSLSSMGSKGMANSCIVLQALLWLGRTPESFVVGRTRPHAAAEELVRPPIGELLRFDSLLVHPALDARRLARGMTWAEVASELPMWNAGMLQRIARGQQIGWPHGMALFLWLDQPAAAFTRGVPSGPEWVTLEQVGKELRVARPEVDALLAAAGISPWEFGGRQLITRQQVDGLPR